MSFDTRAFDNKQYKYRTEDVPVPELEEFFDKGDKLVWTVRNLEGTEVGQTKVAVQKNKDYAAILTALQKDKVSEKLDAIQEIFNLGSNIKTNDVAERLHRLALGSVEPKCDLERAIKVCKVAPVAFYALTNAILRLTGLGMMPGE